MRITKFIDKPKFESGDILTSSLYHIHSVSRIQVQMLYVQKEEFAFEVPALAQVRTLGDKIGNGLCRPAICALFLL